MRRLLFCLTTLIVVGCNNNATPSAPQSVVESPKPVEETAPSFPDLESMDLSSHGLPLLMDLPEGSEFSVPGLADLEIVSGQQFQLFIANGHFNLAEVKERETGPKSFIDYLGTEIDESNRLVVHGESRGRESYLIFCNVVIDGKPYRIDNQVAAWRPKSKEQLEWVLKSIDSLRSAIDPDQPEKSNEETPASDSK